MVWGGAEELERLGTETDMLRAGALPQGITPLLEIFRANIPHLNKLRADTLANKLDLFDWEGEVER